ncbi:MAG TPA: ComEA family DNA-binding protein [Nocardioidaceae bacterium]|nr:ComEA family DNA-binding protein [Nocardioidaceae bacterium]
MRSRRTAQEEMAAIARRRLELLSAEIEGIRTASVPSVSEDRDTAGDRTLPAPPAGEPEATQFPEAQPRAEATQSPEAQPSAEAEPRAEGSPPATSGFLDQFGETERPRVDPLGAAEHWGVGGLLDHRLEELPRGRGRHARRPVAAPGRLGGWVHDRLPPTMQGRVALTAGHLSVVALLVAGAFAITAWWVVRADGGGTVVPAAAWTDAEVLESPAPSPLVTPVAEVPATETEPAVVVVDVAGKVRRPGIATLPLGSRVVDALEAAGGVRGGVDLTTLNLARLLVDGEQILVGVSPPGGVAAPAASGAVGSTGPMVNLNTATAAELEELPGVGPVTAASILQWRADNGPFTAVDELLEVSGIGDATLAELAPFVTL